MLKKNLILGSVLAATCASSIFARPSFFKSGFLAGAHIGASYGLGRFNSNFNTNSLLGVGAASKRTEKFSELFGILGGYRHVLHEEYTIGFDISANIFSNNEFNKKISHTFSGVTRPIVFVNKLSRRLSITPSINFGKIFCGRWHVVLGFGLGVSRFYQDVANQLSVRGVFKSDESSIIKLGFVPSIGVEYAATQDISWVGNLSYEIYQKVSKKFGDRLTSPWLPGSSYKTSINPRYLTLKVGAVYRF